ncbi:hypothetical protein GUJ93_ZPchr0002g23782 [Zizania palustris]|uniref:Uncharacterized protein n=1 Tax=Zizania palustris TaxID=103762 RepID=A0A8J5V3G2_ZIZPA|nr:hypothetical protein GUJ93_ZPchr0002g23782 [Zizania palustris]
MSQEEKVNQFWLKNIIWDSTRSLRLCVLGALALLRTSLAAIRALDRAAPWLRHPSIPDIFCPFGTYLLYDLCMSGPRAPRCFAP